MRVLVLIVSLMYTAASNASVWDGLNGKWVGSGRVTGMDAAVTLEFRPVLDGRGWHLTFSNQMTAADGKTHPFRAEAIYLCKKDSTCRGHWYDSRGVMVSVTTADGGDRLTVEWGDASTEVGRTTYLVKDGTRLEVTDEVLGKDGAWTVFGKTSSTRILSK